MLYHVYCDESRQSQDRYMVLGGIILRSTFTDKFNETMKNFRHEQNMMAELKWTKVSNQKIQQYKRFVDYFFALNNTNILHFHCIIVDNHQVNLHKYSKGDRELGFYKFYYQLLLHCFGKKYCRTGDDKFIVHLDYRNSKYSLNTLKVVLNRGLGKKYNITTEPFVSIEPRESKTTELIQINDIILGAIGFQKNGYELLAETRTSKKELTVYITEQAGLPNLKDNTPKSNSRFTVWNFKLSK